jgi:hypothetical protein
MAEQLGGPFKKFVDWAAVRRCYAERGGDCYAKL